MNLIIDIGNTFAKISIFQSYKIIYKKTVNYLEINLYSFLEPLINTYLINQSLVSSVIGYDENFIQELLNYSFPVFFLTSETKVPIIVKYKPKMQLGNDRLAAVVGATHYFKNNNILVFDAGTALTIDFINSKSEYWGGNISPGLSMRFAALHYQTKKLPLQKANEKINLIGTNTNSAINNGVINGMIYEINGYISSFLKKYDDLKIILTGGDSIFFEKKLKKIIFAKPNLVLTGLNRILNYNVQENFYNS